MAGRLWRHRDFLLLWGGQTISDIGSAVSMLVLPLIAVVYLNASGFEVGALNAVQWLPSLLIGLPAGVWVDRSRRRMLMIGADAVRAVLLASVPVAAALGALGIGQLFGVAFGVGVANVVFQVSEQAYPPSLVPSEDLPEANAKLLGSSSVAQVVGPGFGGLLVQAARAPYALLADAVSYVVSLVSLLLIRAREPNPARIEHESVRTAVAAGARFVRHDPLLRTMTIAPAVANLFLCGYEAIAVLFLVRSVHLAASTVGLLMALVSLGSVAGALVARPLGRRIGTARAMWLSSAVTTPVSILVAFTSRGAGLVFFVVGNVALFFGILIYNVTITAFRQAYCPPEMLGRVVASMRFVLFGTIPVGALLAGALASAVGARQAVLVMMVGGMLSSVLLCASPLRTMRDLPARSAGRASATPAAAHT
ncbi:MAG TPA: MFS transporter [Jatrophihabitans sp.]|jgi:MFS family permease|nr:MFS transporter [Jatrophihabitans sp.]